MMAVCLPGTVCDERGLKPQFDALAIDAALEVVVVDVREHPIERPKKTTRPLFR